MFFRHLNIKRKSPKWEILDCSMSKEEFLQSSEGREGKKARSYIIMPAKTQSQN